MRISFTLYLTLAALLVILTSCYNRSTKNYDEFPVMQESTSAIIDENGFSEKDLARQEAELMRIAAEPLPPYTINAGDLVEIRVYNHPDMTLSTVVTPDGCIGMVFVGQIQIAGLTLDKAAEKIEEGLKDYIRNPKVGISPVKIESQTATIAGAVGRPDMYQISNGMRLTDLYARAGGSSIRYYDGQVLDAAELKLSLFIRDGKIISLDFRRAIEKGDPIHNIPIRKGDYVYIAVRSESMVCLIGDVITPHKRLWDNNLGLLQLLTTGGFVKETYWPYVIIIRGGVANPTLYKVDLDAILQGRAPNVMLEPGDVVYVPKDDVSEFNVFVRKIMPSFTLFNSIRGVRN